MQKLIKDGVVINDDPWTLIEDSECDLNAALDQSPVILPLSVWLENNDLVAGNSNVGVWLAPDQEPDSLAEHLAAIPLIAIQFPAFADGRGYSHARRLRLNFDYAKEIRAFGDVLRDQLLFYKRCGFTSFCLRDDSNLENALNGLEDFSVFYQDAADQIEPPFRRH